jgi:hypothetical protein
MSKRLCLLISACFATWGAHAADMSPESIAGTYEVLICKDACPSWGSKGVLAKGRLVLFAQRLTPQEIEQVTAANVSSMRTQRPNGCFGLEKKDSSYQGYAGIEKAGLTEWSVGDVGLSFLLYRSPDAGYRVDAERRNESDKKNFDGTGKSWGAGVAAPQEPSLDKVVLRRTGAASLKTCLSIQ